MFKKTITAILAVLVFAGVASAQTSASNRGNVLAFNDARDYGQWVARSTGSVASGAQTITVLNDAFKVTPQGRQFLPFSIVNPILVDQENDAVDEVIIPTAVTCSQNGTISTCTIAATFASAHTGQFSLRSGTYGICEARGDLPSGGGTVVVNSGFGGTTSTITTASVAGSCGASTVNILDVRAGSFQFYTWDGAVTYTASTSPFNTSTAANADVTTAVGAPFFYTGAASTATNVGIVTIANQASANGAKIAGLKTRSTSASGDANTIIVTGDDLLEIAAHGADGASYIKTASILFDSIGTIGSTRVPSVIKFFTGTDAAPTVSTLALTLGADQSAVFAGAITNTGTLTMAGTAVINKTAGSLTVQTTTSGNVVLAPAAAATAAVTTPTRFEQAKGTTVVTASCTSGDCTFPGDGNFFLVSGTTTVDGFATAGWQAGSIVTLTFDGNLTLNNAGTVAGGFADLRLVAAGNVSATALDIIMLVYDGTSWMQMAPTLVK